jgi:hypothetical protein
MKIFICYESLNGLDVKMRPGVFVDGRPVGTGRIPEELASLKIVSSCQKA